MLDVRCDCLCVLADRIYIIPSAPKCSIPVFVLHIPPLVVDHNTTLFLQISHKGRLAVSLLKCEYDPDTLLLPTGLLRTNYTIVLRFDQSPIALFRRTLSYDIWGQIQCGTCNSTSNVINYVCHSLCDDLLLIIFAVCSRNLIIIKRRSFFKTHRYKLY